MLVKQNSRAFALEITPESSPLKLAYFQATGRWWILHCTSHNLPKPSGVGNSFKRIPCSISLIWSWNIYCLRSSWNTVLRWSTTHGTQMVCASTCENPASRWFPLSPIFFFSLRFLPDLMKSKLVQFPPVLHRPISGAISGARVSLLGPSTSHRAIFISTYIYQLPEFANRFNGSHFSLSISSSSLPMSPCQWDHSCWWFVTKEENENRDQTIPCFLGG